MAQVQKTLFFWEVDLTARLVVKEKVPYFAKKASF